MTEKGRYRLTLVCTAAIHVAVLAVFLVVGRAWIPRVSLGQAGGGSPDRPLWVDPAIFAVPDEVPVAESAPESEPDLSELVVPDREAEPREPVPPKPKPKVEPKPKPKVESKPKVEPKSKPVEAREVKPGASASKKPSEDQWREAKMRAGEGGAEGPGTGVGERASGGFDMAKYHELIHDRFYRQWIQPTSIFAPRQAFVATLRIRIERDGTISNVALVAPSGNILVDQSVLEAARKVIRIEPLPAGLGRSSYEININFQLD